MLSEAAPAKVNLTLHVTGRRSDGYHLLDSLVVFAGAHDRLTARLADDVSLTLSGPFAAGLEAETDNLVLRAARGLQLACGVRAGAALHLEKNLPVASGIGGGSSDAAAALRLLGRLWGVDPPADRFVALAAKLGADVPVCLRPRAWCMGGIGEVLQPAPALPECGLVLVNPGVAVSTPAVFRARTGVFSAAALWPARWDTAASMALDLAENANDLQAAAIGLCPAIGEAILALRRVESCLLARMSGSGATCFGLFASASAASAAAAALARPGWWCWGGGLWGG